MFKGSLLSANPDEIWYALEAGWFGTKLFVVYFNPLTSRTIVDFPKKTTKLTKKKIKIQARV